MKGSMTLICHLSNAIMRWPNCPPPLHWGQLLGTVPRMTKESDVEAKGFCILIIYLALLLFSRSSHRYNVSITKALLTLTIWPSDPRCSQSHSLDSLVADVGPATQLCSATKRCLLNKRKTNKQTKTKDRPFFRIRPGPGKCRDSWPSMSNAKPTERNEASSQMADHI